MTVARDKFKAVRLLRKKQLVKEGDDRFPVYTLTFADPEGIFEITLYKRK